MFLQPAGKSLRVYQTPPVDALPENCGPATGPPAAPTAVTVAFPLASKDAARAVPRQSMGGRVCMYFW